MSRHRNVRSMNYSDEYDGYDDVYGHSVDDDISISPTDAQQWIYDRARGQQSMSAFIANNRDIAEEAEGDDDDDLGKPRRDSDNFQMPTLSKENQVLLDSCMDAIRDVVGDAFSEKKIVETIIKFDYDFTKSLDAILNPEKVDPPQGLKVTLPPATAVTSDKGEANKLKEKPPAPLIQKEKPVTITVSAATSDKGIIKKGFEIASPLIQSPALSGRNTPESSELRNQGIKAKDISRNIEEIYNKERANEKPHIHMVVIGHVDAGKSTLMGHLLLDLGNVTQRVMHKYEQESKKVGKQSFMYAWVLDETGEERTRGITMDIGESRFETDTKQITLLDAPGHRDFIPNMISGVTQADVALLVVDATTGEFESGFEQGGQTREHALLVRSLGVSQLDVVINKLDTVEWSKERFDEIVGKLRLFLKQAGFKDSDVTYVPCSGLTGENLVKPATDPILLSWYKGPTLLAVIDSFTVPVRSISKPFRMSINDIFKGTGSGYCLSGRLETGMISVNDKILIMPCREQTQIKSITIDEGSRTKAFAGDQIVVTLSSAVDVSSISVGYFLCDLINPIPVATRFQVRIITFNVKVPITIGCPVILHHQALVEPATIVKIKAQLHKGTGEVIKKNPRFLGNNSCALVEIETTKAICIEKYADIKELGRVTLRVAGVTIAAGLVTKILK